MSKEKVKAIAYFVVGVIAVNAVMSYLASSKVPVANTVATKAGF